MKICILQTIHEPYDKRVFHKEAKSLVAAGHTVVSIVPCDDPLPDTSEGVQFRRIPVSKNFIDRFLASLRLVRLGRRERADAYMCVEPESWVSALLVKLLTGRKVVFDVHEYFPTLFARLFPKSMERFVVWMTLKAMRGMARMTDAIVLTKECLRADFDGLRVPCTVVLNTNHLQPPCHAIPEAIQAKYAGHPTIIHQGIFGDARGSYQLLEAMKIVAREFPDVKCICLGDYLYGEEAPYREALRASGMDQYIELLPPVPFQEVPAYIAVSRIGLILFQPVGLQHTLGMPHKMFDYMRESVPVIAPGYAVEIRHVIEEAQCGMLIDVTDPKAIAQAIIHLLNNPEEAQQLGASGRHSVETRYNWETEEKKLLEVFAALGR
jgi:glycosyltransferase involved in cell wall biosynthesis